MSHFRQLEHIPLFVLGSQRSGTTLVGKLLAAHPDVVLGVNGKLLYYLITWVLRDPSERPLDHLRLDEIRFSLQRRTILGLTPEQKSTLLDEVDQLACIPHDMSIANWIRAAWLHVYGRIGPDVKVVGEKYNELMLQIDEVAAIFPDAMFLLVHRDPLDVAESMIRSFGDRPWRATSIENAARKWADWNRRWIEARKRIPFRQWMELPYQELVSDPCASIGRIEQWLALSTGAITKSLLAEVNNESVGRGSRSMGIGRQEFLGKLDGPTRLVAESFGYGAETAP